VVDKVKRSKKGVGYDASKDEYGDMVTRGIIDPLKVTRTALENAASVANMILTTEALVTDLPDKDKPAMPAMPPMPDY
jgi:chaperonin GroEL